MTPKSAKAKGRRLAAKIAEAVREWFDLAPEDVRVTPAGVPGNDLTMSSEALAAFPYDVESKNVERLNIWEALAQVEQRAEREPLLVFSRNGAEMYAVVRFDHFMKLAYNRTTYGDQ